MRLKIRVEGIVQGVGFRPFVYNLATSYGLAGHVGNDERGVFVEAEGSEDVVSRFASDLASKAPPLANVETVRSEEAVPTGRAGFTIVGSERNGSPEALIPADVAPCDACLAEMSDPLERRYRYPFTNCTNCGPRFSITLAVPYDRANTTMAGYVMCDDCRREYEDPRDRRFHAQPICCPACGPRLRLVGGDGSEFPGDPVEEAARLVSIGSIVAVKGVGGFHLAVDAGDDGAVARLRILKRREERPFALMVGSSEEARALVELGEDAIALLESPERPIVLGRRLVGAKVSEQVAPGNRWLGMMLPPSPLHHLLTRAIGRPFVLTSGNVSEQPIIFEDEGAAARLGAMADALLTHERSIAVRADDSVVRTVGGRHACIRRSRGYTPKPISVPVGSAEPVLAVGAELKNTFCLLKGRRALLSQHIGDLENYETYSSFVGGIAHFSAMFGVTPRLVAHDLHPEYLSTKYALELEEAGAELTGVQHHHAHVASCLADNGVSEEVIGIALDGLGYGTDGSLWGGEVLVADCTQFERVGRLAPVPMPGGSRAIKEPWRMAASYLQAVGVSDPSSLDLARRHERSFESVVALARSGVGSPLTSSAGRLFDAVAALIGVRDVISYEGQAAIELEQLVDRGEEGAYRAGISEVGGLLEVDGAAFVREVLEGLGAGVPAPVIAARFHNGLASVMAEVAGKVRERTGIATVALSGGVFQNMVLTDRLAMGLDAEGFRVLLHSVIPPNDGGISLGQAVVAAARRSAGSADPR